MYQSWYFSSSTQNPLLPAGLPTHLVSIFLRLRFGLGWPLRVFTNYIYLLTYLQEVGLISGLSFPVLWKSCDLSAANNRDQWSWSMSFDDNACCASNYAVLTERRLWYGIEENSIGDHCCTEQSIFLRDHWTDLLRYFCSRPAPQAFILHRWRATCRNVEIKSEIITAALKASSTPPFSDNEEDLPAVDMSDDVAEEPPCNESKVDPDVNFWASWDTLQAQSQSAVTRTSSSRSLLVETELQKYLNHVTLSCWNGGLRMPCDFHYCAPLPGGICLHRPPASQPSTYLASQAMSARRREHVYWQRTWSAWCSWRPTVTFDCSVAVSEIAWLSSE